MLERGGGAVKQACRGGEGVESGAGAEAGGEAAEIEVGFEAVGEAVEVGLASGGEVDGRGPVQAGPGEQGGECLRLVEQAVEVCRWARWNHSFIGRA